MRDIKFYTIESAGLSEGIEMAGHRTNQDSYLIFTNGNLFTAVVSDGIGGKSGGEIASARYRASKSGGQRNSGKRAFKKF